MRHVRSPILRLVRHLESRIEGIRWALDGYCSTNVRVRLMAFVKIAHESTSPPRGNHAP
jgi:hypothetical protein